jgi:hypothetical protein
MPGHPDGATTEEDSVDRDLNRRVLSPWSKDVFGSSRNHLLHGEDNIFLTDGSRTQSGTGVSAHCSFTGRVETIR